MLKGALQTIAALFAVLQTPLLVPQNQIPTRSTQTVQLTAEQCKCSIEVTVKRPGSGDPVSDVNVSLTALPYQYSVEVNGGAQTVTIPSAPVASPSAVTDSNGRAVFRNLAQGGFRVLVQRNGYFIPADTDTPLISWSTTVFIGPTVTPLRSGVPIQLIQQPTQRVMLTMFPGATISGRMEDANHKSANSVPVGAFRIGYSSDGARAFIQTGATIRTDDRGEFRIFWLHPGEYYIRTIPTNLGQRGNPQVYPDPTYFPGTQAPESATRIVVREGQDYVGADFNLPPPSGVTISGTLLEAVSEGNSVSERNRINGVYLLPRSPDILEPVRNTFTVTPTPVVGNPDKAEVSFEIHNVPPGSYDFYPVILDTTAAPGATSRIYSTGRVPIEVGAENIRDFKVAIQPGSDLKVHVRFEAAPPITPQTPLLSMADIRVVIQSKDNLPSVKAVGPASEVADGNLIMPNVVEGQYYVARVWGLPLDAYVSEIRLGSRQLDENGYFTVEQVLHETLEIAVRRSGTMVQGSVQDAQGKPVTGARIVLIPDAARRENVQLNSRFSTSGDDGNFPVYGLAPGSYRMFAFEHILTDAYRNAEFMKEYQDLGVRLTVTGGVAKINTPLLVIPSKQ